MDEKKLTAEEIDTIGEIMNISMGAAAKATTLIDHYNEVWRTLIVPDNPVQVKSVDTIVYDWQSH